MEKDYVRTSQTIGSQSLSAGGLEPTSWPQSKRSGSNPKY